MRSLIHPQTSATVEIWEWIINIIPHSTMPKSKLLKGVPGILQWHHNGLDGVSDHQPHNCLLNCSFGRRSKKTSKIRVTLAFVRGIHRSPVNSPQKGPVTRKTFPFDDVIMSRDGEGLHKNVLEYPKPMLTHTSIRQCPVGTTLWWNWKRYMSLGYYSLCLCIG